MNIPPKYEDVVAQLEAALGREAALREELETEKRANYNAKVALKAASETCELWKGRTTNLTQANAALQQRLTVAEQRESAVRLRESLLKEKLSDCESSLSAAENRTSLLNRLLSDASGYTRHPDYDWDIGFFIEVEAALKPAEEGEGA